jgi:hypothetical protein
MSALIGDVLTGAVTPQVCNAAVNAGGKLLKIVDMQHRYGVANLEGQKDLRLCESPQTPGDKIRELESRLSEIKKMI